MILKIYNFNNSAYANEVIIANIKIMEPARFLDNFKIGFNLY